MSIEAVEIVILGRPYKVSCPQGQQDALRQAADQLTDKLIELRQRSKVSSNEQLAIMAALNFCHELCLEKEKSHQYSETMDKRIKMLQDRIEKALTEPTESVESVESDDSLKARTLTNTQEISRATESGESVVTKFTKPSVRNVQF